MDAEACNKQNQPGDKPWVAEPFCAVICKKSKIIAVEKSIEGIKHDTKTHHGSRHHFSFGFQTERKYQVAVKVMHHPKGVYKKAYCISGVVAHKEKKRKNQQGRSFHNYPSQAVIDKCAPFFADKFTIRGCDFKEQTENYKPYQHPGNNELIKKSF